MNIARLIDQLESRIPDLHRHCDKVSKVTVGWHIDHSFKVIISVSKVLQKSNPDDYKWKFNFNRSLILALGWFPRGVARAPRSTRPDGDLTEQSLQDQLILAKKEILKIMDLPPKVHFSHRDFGILHLKSTKRFLEVHTHHHLQIIKDIISKSPTDASD